MRIDELIDQRNDNARHFVDFPEVIFYDELSDYLALLEGCEVTEFEADGVFRVWIEFEYRENKFFVENKMGDFWFFVEDPKCEEEILMEIANHLRALLEKEKAAQE